MSVTKSIKAFALSLIGIFAVCGVQAREVLPNVTKEQVCISGYSKTVRPSVNKIAKWKRLHLLPTQLWSDYVVDHTVPLGIGGAPMGNNLQLQTIADAKKKDRLENKAHHDLCGGWITLQQAQERF
jgi:hypothetical protein